MNGDAASGRTGRLTGVCSWESSEPPKLADRVQILAPLLPAWSHASCPWSVPDSHATLRRSQTRFDSWRGHRPGSRRDRACLRLPASVSGARRSSKPQGRVRFPGGGLSVPRISRPRSVPDPHTTLRRSETRFDSWRGHRSTTVHAIVDQDAGARRPGDRLQPGSSGFDSHRRLSSYPASHRSRSRLVDDFSPSVDRSRRRSPC